MKLNFRKIFLILFISFRTILVNGQWVTIPDSIFVNWLNSNGFATCLNGNLLDTTCNLILTPQYLDCSNSNIQSLEGIQYFKFLSQLMCQYNQISYMPQLPNTCTHIYCHYNQLSNLPILPPNLTLLFCNSNQLTSLPSLPSSLANLNCGSNQLTSLPNLPNTIGALICNANLLTNLPPLNNLNQLNCGSNLLTSLPPLPSNLNYFRCYNNPLTSLPEFPNYLSTCYIQDNPNLTCLPELKNIGTLVFTNTGIQCLPNYGNVTSSSPLLSTLPLCDLFNNNGCQAFWNISGKVYTDTNSNCIADINEWRLANLKLMLDSAGTLIQQCYTGSEGFFSFDTDTGTYTYTIDTTDLPVFLTCPAIGFHTSILTAADSMDYDMDFAMKCKPGFDIGVQSVVRDSGNFIPANFAEVKITAGDVSNLYGFHCADGVSGFVQVVFNGPITYISPAAGSLIPIIAGDTLFYPIVDFGSVDINSDFKIIIHTDTTATIGSQICFSVSVSPLTGDNNPANNSLLHCFPIGNSFDPNSKYVFPSNIIDTSQQWLTYTINFQNIGTAPAQHIYILDTLDANFDLSTFTLLAYSHRPLIQIINNVARFNFPNINLPDSTNDEVNSHGYVQYRIKLLNGLPIGTLIENHAYIFFDFNAPIVTNTVVNLIQTTTGTQSLTISKEKIIVYPNPAQDNIYINFIENKTDTFEFIIFNSISKISKIKTCDATQGIQSLDISELSNGLYFWQAYSKKDIINMGKLIIQR